jgi:HNH endonuclease
MADSAYPKERLVRAAQGSGTLSEALTKLGVDPWGPSRPYIRDRMRMLGVETSHFSREGARWTREVLAPAVAASSNMYDVLRRLGVPVVGGYHSHISRRVRALGIDTSHFVGRRHPERRQRRCRPEELLVRQEDLASRRIPGDRLKRALIAMGRAEVCGECGIPPTWQGRPLPLEVDHVDGDWRNNLPANLRLLCPNCHSATDTYRGRNKGRTR